MDMSKRFSLIVVIRFQNEIALQNAADELAERLLPMTVK